MPLMCRCPRQTLIRKAVPPFSYVPPVCFVHAFIQKKVPKHDDYEARAGTYEVNQLIRFPYGCLIAEWNSKMMIGNYM